MRVVDSEARLHFVVLKKVGKYMSRRSWGTHAGMIPRSASFYDEDRNSTHCRLIPVVF